MILYANKICYGMKFDKNDDEIDLKKKIRNKLLIDLAINNRIMVDDINYSVNSFEGGKAVFVYTWAVDSLYKEHIEEILEKFHKNEDIDVFHRKIEIMKE